MVYHKMNKFKIVSGFTINTPYEKEIETLIESIQKNEIINYEIIPYKNMGSWSANCQYKAIIIKNQLLNSNIPIIWLDADAVLYSYPNLFDSIPEDIAFCTYYGGVASGTLYMKPTKQIISLCEEWISMNSKNTEIFDQKNLNTLVKQNNIKYYKLPISYCKIDFAKCHEKIVIGQNQASRRFKKIINKL